MPRKRSERTEETYREKWERHVGEVHKPPEQEPDTYENVVEFYTAYLCGSLDTLAVFKDALYAADVRDCLKETVASIVKDAWVLQAKGQTP